jgi:hypothetical protein
MRTAFLVVAVSCVTLSAAAHAGEIITRYRADPYENAKVQRYLAEAYRVSTPGSEYNYKKDIKVQQGCQMNMGNVTTQPGQQAPREVHTVVKGNIINFCR